LIRICRRPKIAVAGCDQSEIYPDRAISPQTLEFLFLQDAEQFGLQGGSDLADLVEEQSTLIR